MKKTILSLLTTAVIMVLCGCASSKQVAYFQNADYENLASSRGLYEAKIMPKDILTITVNTTDPQAATPFNLTISNTMDTSGRLNTSGSTLQTYLVDNDGVIRYPVVGDLKVAGLTTRQCEDLIKEKILPYMSVTENPVVTVKLSSYRVSVIGEVTKPGTFTASTEKMSVLEALAQAGDLTIYGKRENVMLIRESANGEKTVHRLDLTDANIISSPYFYLQQNDVIYVEPNKVKTRNSAIGTSTTLLISITGTLISLTSLIVNITD